MVALATAPALAEMEAVGQTPAAGAEEVAGMAAAEAQEVMALQVLLELMAADPVEVAVQQESLHTGQGAAELAAA